MVELGKDHTAHLLAGWDNHGVVVSCLYFIMQINPGRQTTIYFTSIRCIQCSSYFSSFFFDFIFIDYSHSSYTRIYKVIFLIFFSLKGGYNFSLFWKTFLTVIFENYCNLGCRRRCYSRHFLVRCLCAARQAKTMFSWFGYGHRSSRICCSREEDFRCGIWRQRY